MISSILVYSLSIFSLYWLSNYAEITMAWRAWNSSRLPQIVQKALSCSFCFAFWCMVALSLFTGFTPLILTVPSATMFWNLIYLNLKGVCDK